MKKILLCLLFLIYGCQERAYTFDSKSNGITYRKAGEFHGFKVFDMVHIVSGGVILEDFNTETLLTIKGAHNQDVVLRNISNKNETLIDKTVSSYVSIDRIESVSLINYSTNEVYLKDAKIEKIIIDNQTDMVIVDSKIDRLEVKNINQLKLINCEISEIIVDSLNQLIVDDCRVDLSKIDSEKITVIK